MKRIIILKIEYPNVKISKAKQQLEQDILFKVALNDFKNQVTQKYTLLNQNSEKSELVIEYEDKMHEAMIANLIQAKSVNIIDFYFS